MKETDPRDITLSDASLSPVVRLEIGRTIRALVSVHIEVLVGSRWYVGTGEVRIRPELEESLDELLSKS